MSGISDLTSKFYVSPLAAGISVSAIILAGLSYFLVPEAYRTRTAYAAYWMLLFAIAALTSMTGGSNSPFVATWMVAVIFAGIFGTRTLGVLFVLLNAYFGYTLWATDVSSATVLGFVLAGELPILVSYVLWHGKSSTEKTKERAYYDLANELDQVSNKAEVVINAISDGVIAVNNQGQIELINPAAQKIVGWGHQDALNLSYKSVLQMLAKDGSEITKSNDPVF
ncbi:PAS domain-containing protein, partial [Candidatus Saccharibacteria bacterium]|nr:PAS domain-containing protein [Candidatus Saccharibacteria bacterium]